MGQQKITITNEKTLSQGEIERMVAEAEKYKAEDEANRLRIEAKNGLENYAYSMKSTLAEDGLASKLSDDDKSTVNAKIDETMAWLDANLMAEKEEYEAKQKELEAAVLQKAAGGAGPRVSDMGGAGVGSPGGGPSTDAPLPADADEGPKIEEID